MDTPAKSTPRDVFLYFLMIFALATAAANLGTILFQFINLYVPGEVGYYGGYSEGLIRWAVASLIVVFPVLLWVLRFLNRDMAAHPEKRDLKIRKWLVYLTLFVTGITVIGDLVTLIYNFLQGDITTRFILKVIVILWLAGSIFYYFLKDLHNQSPRGRKVIQWATIVIVIASLIGGFMAVGSPASQRARANDDHRVADLQSIEGQIIQYWQDKGKLPATLADLPAGIIGGYVVPTDPKTGLPYDYSTQGALQYRLCATFEAASSTDTSRAVPMYYSGGVSYWDHQAGYQCFDGKIDPDRFRPAIKPL